MTEPFQLALQLRDRGIARASQAEGEAFQEAASALVRKLATMSPTVHIDDYLAAAGPRPRHFNAMGAVWLTAIRAGWIERTGTVKPCRLDARKHGHNYPVYRSLIYCGR